MRSGRTFAVIVAVGAVLLILGQARPESPSLTFGDPVGDGTIDIVDDGGPFVGASCPKTDILDVAFSDTTSEMNVSVHLSDLGFLCPASDPLFQTYTYAVSFKNPRWDSIVVELGLTTSGGYDATIAATNATSGDVYTSQIDVNLSYDFSTVIFRVPLGLAAHPISRAYAFAEMDTCGGGHCYSATVSKFADRAPDFGYANE